MTTHELTTEFGDAYAAMAVSDIHRVTIAAEASYMRLAARLNADPVQLAETDVLGLLYDACEFSAHAIESLEADVQQFLPGTYSGSNKARAALAACRKEGT